MTRHRRSSRPPCWTARRASVSSTMDRSRPSQRSRPANAASASTSAPLSAMASAPGPRLAFWLMGESARASAGLGPKPAAVATPAARPAAGLLALSVVADGRSGAPAAGQLAGLAGRLELAGVWWREPPLTGPPADDLPALLEALGSESGPAAAGLIVDARRLPPGPGHQRDTERSVVSRSGSQVCGQGPLAGIEPVPRRRPADEHGSAEYHGGRGSGRAAGP